MDVEPGSEVEQTEVINKLLKELYQFIDELEQQVREDLYCFKQGIKTDDASLMEVQQLAKMSSIDDER